MTSDFKSTARAVVIGGGVVGVSTLYHLAKKGWDAVLLERAELTSGSTWHAAGLLPLFNMSYSVGQLHKYSVRFYQELPAETGMDSGFSQVGNIRLATNRDRMDEFRQYAAVAATIGVKVDFLTPEEVVELWPLAVVGEGKRKLVGAIVHREDGYIQPADLTNSLAAGARKLGGVIHTRTTVTAIERRGDEWIVKTDKGDIACEHVVCATGNFARQTGKMVGLDIPVIPVEHQYILTGDIPEVVARKKAGQPEMGVLRGADGSWYMREERGGLLLGPYEKGAPACYIDGPTEGAEYELFPDDIERLAPHIEDAVARVPCFEKGGFKRGYNGAICYTPDGSPIVGPAWGLRNFWLNEGHSFGITAAGGAGWQIAEWIVEGEPTVDMLGVDPRRLRRLRVARLPHRKKRGGLRECLHDSLPRRRAPGRAPFARRALLQSAARARRGFRAKIRMGARQFFRRAGRRAKRRLVVSPLELVRMRSPRMRKCRLQCRRFGHDGFRKMPRVGPRRARFFGRTGRQQTAADGAHRALPRAQHARRRAFGIHDFRRGRRFVLSRFGRRFAAARSRLAAKASARKRRALRSFDQSKGVCWSWPAPNRAN